MNYPIRTLLCHAALLFFVAISFILPVVFGGGALLPVRASGAIGIVLGLFSLGDSARLYFARSQAHTRGLRILSAIGALSQLIGWAVWIYIYSNISIVGTAPFRIGTFALSVGAVLSLFVIAIAALDLRAHTGSSGSTSSISSTSSANSPGTAATSRPRRHPRRHPR